MLFEEFIQSSFRNRLSWALIELFDKPRKMPIVGEEFYYISGSRNVYLGRSVAVKDNKTQYPKSAPFTKYGYISYELREKGKLINRGEAEVYRIVKPSLRVKKLIAKVNKLFPD